MRLINGKERDISPVQQVPGSGLAEPLRGKVEQVELDPAAKPPQLANALAISRVEFKKPARTPSCCIAET